MGLDTISWRVGPVSSADGSYNPARADKEGAQVVSQAHGRYFEGSRRGNSFGAGTTGSGVAPGTAIGTTAAGCLYNPVGSGYVLSIQKVSVGYISGTLGAGTLFHCANPTTTQTAPSSGTANTIVCLDVGNSTTAVGVFRSGATTVAPTILRPLCSLTALLATTAVGLYQILEDVAGEIVIEPGCSYQIQAVAAAGTSPLIAIGVSWEEIAIPS